MTMAEYRTLEHGELTRIIIATLANSEQGMSTIELTNKLRSWNINVNRNQMGARLHTLALSDRIVRIRRGVYGTEYPA